MQLAWVSVDSLFQVFLLVWVDTIQTTAGLLRTKTEQVGTHSIFVDLGQLITFPALQTKIYTISSIALMPPDSDQIILLASSGLSTFQTIADRLS